MQTLLSLSQQFSTYAILAYRTAVLLLNKALFRTHMCCTLVPQSRRLGRLCYLYLVMKVHASGSGIILWSIWKLICPPLHPLLFLSFYFSLLLLFHHHHSDWILPLKFINRLFLTFVPHNVIINIKAYFSE